MWAATASSDCMPLSVSMVSKVLTRKKPRQSHERHRAPRSSRVRMRIDCQRVGRRLGRSFSGSPMRSPLRSLSLCGAEQAAEFVVRHEFHVGVFEPASCRVDADNVHLRLLGEFQDQGDDVPDPLVRPKLNP